MKDSANHQKASDNLIASLNEKITKLTSMLEKSSLSASEAQWLARYRQRQRFKRNAEQKDLLKSGKEVTREEEKSDWPEDSNDDVPSTPSSASGDQTPAKRRKSIGQAFYSHRLSEEQAIYDCSYLSYAS